MHHRCRSISSLFYLVFGLLCFACQPIVAPAQSTILTDQHNHTPAGGQLAYIGSDGNVYVVTADRQTKIAITHDASSSPEGNGRSYHRVAWSRDNWLAFAAVERTLNTTHSELYVAAPHAPAQQVGHSDDHFVIYLYWAPTTCPSLPDCHRLAYLIGNQADMALRLVELNGDRITDEEIGVAQPFYFSWAAHSRSLLWHTGGSAQFNPTAHLALYDIANKSVEEVAGSPGSFVAPAWSPTGNDWLDVIATESGMTLRRMSTTPITVTAIAVAKYEMAFAWSPDGQRIAYASRFYSDDPFYGPIYVYENATGESRRLTDRGLHVQAFFWSPDSTRLGYLNWLALPNEDWAQWRVYNLVTGQDRGFDAFDPSFSMRMVIGSFNQYAQSDRFWSPDGRYLTYADRDRSLVERIWLVDTHAPKDAQPILVDEGSIGVWSWR
jgi:Tol biopolymer transport system component